MLRLLTSQLHEARGDKSAIWEQTRADARAMAQVRHENVVQLRGVCLDLRHLCLLMEYAERGSVLDVLRAHPNLPLWRRFELLRGAEKNRGARRAL